jgi:GTP-binding protein
MKISNPENLPVVVIFGRTNVGKSTLFNCLTEKKHAIVSDIAGTTRDANHGTVEWQKAKFELIDTGGIINLEQLVKPSKKTANDPIQTEIEKQAKTYLDAADVVLFVVDNRTGLLPQDRQLVLLLKKLLADDFKKVLLVANKVESMKHRFKASEFHQLAMGEVLPVSAVTGAGSGDLLDVIVDRINALPPKAAVEEKEELKEIKVIMIGKPNVGKSSLLNALCGMERVIVSPIAHTTREPQDTVLEYGKRKIRLIDTAGLSRQGVKQQKKNPNGQLEKLGIEKSLESLEKADIALFVMDVNEPLTHQDSKVMSEIIDRQKSLIIIANKWDLIEEKDTKKFTLYINRTFPFALWAPILFVSAKTKAKTPKVLDLILEVARERALEPSASVLNTFLMKIVKRHLPAKAKGVKHPHIHKFELRRSNPPLFEVRIGAKDTLHFSYVRFIANRLREKFGFKGTPIRIWVSKNKKVHGQQNEGRGYVPLDMMSPEQHDEEAIDDEVTANL